MKILISILLLAALFFININLAEIQDPKLHKNARDYIKINGSYYYISPDTIYYTAVEAVRICTADGMKLVSFQTKEKQDTVLGYLRENGYSSAYWTSGVRFADKTWIWSATGQLIESYTNWFILEPDEPWLRDACMFIGFESTYWHDSDCKTDCCIGLICEY